MAGVGGPDRVGSGFARLEWSQTQAEVVRTLEGIAQVVRQRYPLAEVEAVTARVLKSYSPRERLRRKSVMTAEEQAKTAEVFFAIDLFTELVPVLPELARQVVELEQSLRRDRGVVEAWRELSPGFLIDGSAPPLHGSAAPGELGWFKSWRNPWEAMERASHGRGVETLRRIPSGLHQIPDHHDDGSWLEEAFLRYVDREMHRALHPFGLAGTLSRDAVVSAVQLVHGSEWSVGFESVIPDLDDVSTADGLFSTALQNMRAAAARQARGPGYASTFDLVRLGFAVQRRYFAAFPGAATDSGDGWLAPLRSMIFSRGQTPEAVAWSSTLRRMFPYDAANAQRLEKLQPAGTYRVMEGKAPDFRAYDGDAGRYDFVLEQARSLVLESFRRERLENEQSGKEVPAWDVFFVNGVLNKKLELALTDVYVDANKRTVEQIPDFESQDDDDDGDSRRARVRPSDSFVLNYADDGTVIDSPLRRGQGPDSPLLRGQGPDYPLEDGDRSKKRTAVPWVDEFLLWTPQILDWWKMGRRMGGAKELFSKNEINTLKMLTSFWGWLAGEVRSREQDRAPRRIRHASVGVEIVPLETQLRNENARFDGGLTEALVRWTAVVPQLQSQAARTKMRTDIKDLFKTIYQEIDQRWGLGERPQPGREVVEIFDSIPGTVRDYVWARLIATPASSEDSD